MTSLLAQLKAHTVVVADTGELSAIQRFQPEDATTNPSLILKAIAAGQYPELLSAAIAQARQLSDDLHQQLQLASDRLVVAMGVEILRHVPGRVSTEVPARLSFDTAATLSKARELCQLYQQAGIPRERILIKIASTWEGIQAARVLEQEGIQCNLTLIFNFAQARACAEAGVFLISPFVGRILDWHVKQQPHQHFPPTTEPGVESVKAIYQFFKKHDYRTVVMGASFRNAGEILALSGCDRLTISPTLLEELAAQQGQVPRALQDSGERAPRPVALDEASFRWQMNEDAMATEKLAEGIRVFHQDQCKLDALLRQALLN
ncbi:transaldolase [Pokkaliibacter sp. MBI-7]|uniref:transaldolase n=1 Tax=Pokkaliibacter sp. MBI-7 TaxID=3040600 RepID=UPI00244A017F|nr:transaldolase [Pokkaliibacter sp. MBI-7]MDH2434487.1 transaldolase [Pokkaliibacter sp. MBI-7]